MKGFSLIVKLVVAQAISQPARIGLTCAAIIASSAAVAWVVSGYDALVAQFDENAQKYLGRYDLVLVPSDLPFGRIAPLRPQLIEALKNDPAIGEVNPIAQSRVTVSAAGSLANEETAIDLLVGSRPPVNGAPPLDPLLVATAATRPPYDLINGQWLTEDSLALQAVLSRNAARRLNVKVGDEVLVTSIANRVRLKVIGVVDQPNEAPSEASLPSTQQAENAASKTPRVDTNAPDEITPLNGIGVPVGVVNSLAIEAIYVRFPVAELTNGFPTKLNVIQLSLREGVSTDAFRDAWLPKLKSEKPSLAVLDYASIRRGIETNESVGHKLTQAYAATGLATLAAVFIIFTTLSMGVSERRREFALLRAIALTRSQMASLVFVESLLLALIGWIGGLLAGQSILWLAAHSRPEFLADGGKLGSGCILFSGVSVLAGAFGAAVVPAWQAMRTRPLDAIAGVQKLGPRRWPYICFGIGLLLMLLAPASVFLISMGNSSRVLLFALASYPCLLIGTMLLVPATIIACEKWLGPQLALLLGLPADLLRSQLSSNLLRTVGATLAITSGLALFAATQIWGHAMLQNYIPGDWLPDALVAFHPLGLSDLEASLVAEVEGIKAEEILPLAVEQAKFAWPEDKLPDNLRRDNAVIMGLDAVRAIGGDAPFLDLDFVQGDRRRIAQTLAKGRYCIVGEDFVTLTGLRVGDQVPFSPPNSPDEVVQYEIVGVVSIPGWQWMTKFSGVRRHFVRTSSLLFADAERVVSDFKLDRNEFFWMNLDGTVPLADLEASLQEVAEESAGMSFTAPGYGEVKAHRPFVRITTTENVRKAIKMVAAEVIWSMSYLPLVTLAITAIALANAMAASVRARNWSIGILRSIGVTRGQIVRLILSEAILIAIVACAISLAFGLISGWCNVGMSRYSGTFYSPPVASVPWGAILAGFAATLVICTACAIWPAIRTSRREPLSLLEAGRSAM